MNPYINRSMITDPNAFFGRKTPEQALKDAHDKLMEIANQ